MKKIVAKKYKSISGYDLEEDDFSKNEAEEEKKSLSKRNNITLRVNRQSIDISLEEFQEAISTEVAQAEMLCESTIDDAGIEISDIKAVLLAGGSTRIPLVQESIKRVFGQEPVAGVNVDEVVALGAALYAAYKGDRSRLTEVQKNAIQKIKVTESTSKYFGTISFNHDTARDEIKLSNTMLSDKIFLHNE